MRWLAFVVLSMASLAGGQEGTTIARLSLAEDRSDASRLVEFLSRASGDGAGLEWVIGTDREYASQPAREPAADGALAEFRVDLNVWRGRDPDRFEPGPMNALLGAFGVADARWVDVDVSADRVVARWERRQDDPSQVPAMEIVIAERTEREGLEVWAIEGLGIGGFVGGAFRAGLALEPGERAPSDWTFGDAWLRGRAELLRSLDRATARTELIVTDHLHTAVVFWFDPAIRAASLERSALRIVPEEGAPEIRVLGRSVRPVFEVVETAGGAAVVMSVGEADVSAVARAIAGGGASGGDGP